MNAGCTAHFNVMKGDEHILSKMCVGVRACVRARFWCTHEYACVCGMFLLLGQRQHVNVRRSPLHPTLQQAYCCQPPPACGRRDLTLTPVFQRPPRQGQHGRSLSYAAGSTRGMPRSRHHRTSSAPSRHQRRKKVVGEGRRPSSARSARGGSGGSGGFSREMSAPSPRAEGAARFVAPPSTAPAKLTAGPNMQARSLMFTSAARKRGGGGDNAARGAASPARGAAPPSPSGSALSACSDLSAVSGGSALDGDPVRRPPVNLTLPLSIDESSSRSGVHPVVSVVTVAAPESSSVAGGSAARRRGAGGGGGGGPPWTVMTTRATTATSADTAKVVVPSPAPAPAPTDVVAAVERLESPSARERMRPAAAAVAELWTALRALRPARVGGLGGADQVVEAAGAASSAVKGANALMNATEDGGGGDGGGGGEEVMDEEAAEAAGALLAQAGDAVETLAQVKIISILYSEVFCASCHDLLSVQVSQVVAVWHFREAV